MELHEVFDFLYPKINANVMHYLKKMLMLIKKKLFNAYLINFLNYTSLWRGDFGEAHVSVW